MKDVVAMNGPAGAGGAVADLAMQTEDTASAVNALGRTAGEYRQTIGALLAAIEAGEAAIGAGGELTDILAQKFASEYSKTAHLKESLNELGLRLDAAASAGRGGVGAYIETEAGVTSQMSSFASFSNTVPPDVA